MVEIENFLSWSQIAKAPNKAGVYAWYFRPEFTKHDLRILYSDLALTQDEQSKKALIRKFLIERLFKYFKQTSYKIDLNGQLKAKYQGTIEHEQEISESLISRINEKPNRLLSIIKILEQSSPLFASPLYVGMSGNIRERLIQHTRTIKNIKEERRNAKMYFSDEDLSLEEKNFAERVVEKEIPTSRLFVAFQVTQDDQDVHIDIENIINRLYYPILGRN
jgi:hypothetical protein